MNHCAFSGVQDVCSKLQNQAKCDSAVLTTYPLNIHFFVHFFSATKWLLQLEQTIIARLAIVPYLLNTILTTSAVNGASNVNRLC